MKKLFLLFIALNISLLTFAQDNGDLENQFYFRFGLSNPTHSYFGIDSDDSFWDESKRIGGVFELGSIFMINSWRISDGLRLGINVDYAEFTYHQISSTVDDSAIGIFKFSSKVGPSISYKVVPHLTIDVYVKYKIPWVAGMVFADSNGTVDDDDAFGGALGTGYSIGFNVRYRFLMLGFDFNRDSMELTNINDSDIYFGNAKDNSNKTPMPYYNATFGFTF